MDESIPSGNAIAARVLLRMGYLSGNTKYLDAAQRALQAAWPAVTQLPHAHSALLNAAEEYLHPTETVIIRGVPEQLSVWSKRVAMRYSPRQVIFTLPHGATGLSEYKAPDNGVCAYVCKAGQCLAPVTKLDELLEMFPM